MAGDPVGDFGLQVAEVAERTLRLPPGEEALGALLVDVERRVAVALAGTRTGREPRPACVAGCAACCTVNVATLAPEGAVIAAWLRARLSPADAAVRAEALLRFHERVRWADDGERIRSRLACPFLDVAGACAVHPVRPLVCRSLTSLDADDCRRAVAERAEEDGPGLVRVDVLQKALYDEALSALAAALAARGLDSRSRDVSGMAGAFLADPGLAAAFGAGARVPIE